MSSPSVSSRPTTCTISVELPEAVVGLLGPTSQEAAVRLKQLALLELFRRGDLSGGKAADLLGLSRAEWLDLLASLGVPHTIVTEESLEHDLQTLAGRMSPLPNDAQLPSGWDHDRVQRVVAHYERQAEDEATDEDEQALQDAGQTVM